MLVGQKENFLRARKGPVKGLAGVRRSAHQPAALSAESLDRGRRVHVRNRHNLLRREAGGHQRIPAVFDLPNLRHVGHRAAGVQVGQNHLLACSRRIVGTAQHVGALRHKVHAAKDEILRLGLGRDFGELVGVAGEIRKTDHFIALIVVAEQNRALAELRARRRNPLIHAVVGQGEVVIERTTILLKNRGRQQLLLQVHSKSLFRLQSKLDGRGC